jgi:hypothetical protein
MNRLFKLFVEDKYMETELNPSETVMKNHFTPEVHASIYSDEVVGDKLIYGAGPHTRLSSGSGTVQDLERYGVSFRDECHNVLKEGEFTRGKGLRFETIPKYIAKVKKLGIVLTPLQWKVAEAYLIKEAFDNEMRMLTNISEDPVETLYGHAKCNSELSRHVSDPEHFKYLGDVIKNEQKIYLDALRPLIAPENMPKDESNEIDYIMKQFSRAAERNYMELTGAFLDELEALPPYERPIWHSPRIEFW